MAEFCKLVPTVKKRINGKEEEKDSALFTRIKEVVKDYETSWELWAYSRTPEFKNKYKDKIEYDEWGEVTFSSLINALNLTDAYKKDRSAEAIAKDYGFDGTTFEGAGVAINRINEFNSKEKDFIAILQRVDGKYQIKVFPRKAKNEDTAKQQAYNYALTGELLNIMRSLGFDVTFATDSRYAGMFNPEKATFEDGFIKIIEIAKGQLGEEALPEEFAHFILEGLINHPLVERLLNTINDDLVKEILGEDYDAYSEEYDNDFIKLRKEAAGKLLGEYIRKKETIKQDEVQKKKSLLSRLWGRAKEMFSKVTKNHISAARMNAQRQVANIFDLIANNEVQRVFDASTALNGERLLKIATESAESFHKIQSEVHSIEGIARIGKELLSKKANIERGKSFSGKAWQGTLDALQTASNLIDSQKYEESARTTIDHINSTLQYINGKYKAAKKLEDSGNLSDIKIINEAAKIARMITEAQEGYESYLASISSINAAEEASDWNFIDEQEAAAFAKAARDTKDVLDDLISAKERMARTILTNACRTVLPNDITRGIGADRLKVMCLEEILKHAVRDINFVDRWFTAMSDADDPLLVLMEGIVKNQQYERDMEMEELRVQIAHEDKKLRDAGYSSDFMIERKEDGEPTGRILSVYDWDSFNEAQKKERERLDLLVQAGELSEEELENEMREWRRGTENGIPRMKKIFVDPEHERAQKEKREKDIPEHAVYEWVPNPKLYSKKAHVLDDLSTAQRNYYDEMIRIKREMMTKIPHRGQNIYKAIYISKDFIEGVIDNSTGNPIAATLEYFKKKYIRRPDDIGFGTGENFQEDILRILTTEKDPEKAANSIIRVLNDALDDDVRTPVNKKQLIEIIKQNKKDPKKGTEEVVKNIAAQEFYLVETDFGDNIIQKLPIYYTRKLNNMRMLSTDFTGCMVAYSAMAINYEKMNEVVDILEVARDFIGNRKVGEQRNGKQIMSSYRVLNDTYTIFMGKKGVNSAIAGRYKDWMDSVVYEQRKNPGTEIHLGKLKFNSVKTLETIKDYTGLIGLGLNLFSAISNLAVGKLQQWIEAAGGEYFNVKEYTKAIKQYHTEIWGHLAEMNSPIKKNKLSLLIAMFDPMGDYFNSIRDSSYAKSAFSRIMGNNMFAYIGQNAGEHALHCQTMLAMLNHIKLIDTKNDNKKVSLYDALKVETDKNGITKLVLQEGLVYERELIDNTGTPAGNKNYGKPLRDEKGKIMKETISLDNKKNFKEYIKKQKKRIRKVNDSLNGAFGLNDKGAIHKVVLGRMVMQFRQWMPAHYERRFARAHYDADLEQWREGYYITVWKAIAALYKDTGKVSIRFTHLKDTLSDHEKANLRRAVAEVTEFGLLIFAVNATGHLKDKDRSWLEKMLAYQFNRMKLEVGASMPCPDFFDNIGTLMQGPVPASKTYTAALKLFKLNNLFNEVESGRYKGWSEWTRDFYKASPLIGQIDKAVQMDQGLFRVFD